MDLKFELEQIVAVQSYHFHFDRRYSALRPPNENVGVKALSAKHSRCGQTSDTRRLTEDEREQGPPAPTSISQTRSSPSSPISKVYDAILRDDSRAMASWHPGGYSIALICINWFLLRPHRNSLLGRSCGLCMSQGVNKNPGLNGGTSKQDHERNTDMKFLDINRDLRAVTIRFKPATEEVAVLLVDRNLYSTRRWLAECLGVPTVNWIS
ncbi:uncharacterized protein EDB93DRAFT_1103726 [Suillus bovinus]|uniref:uncharacterized protein n=1 Tax=Suillus bovinus TaxID=48563 RepID=UPI001B88567F|nr:uncharacterized protein EDB93DRAFT_1103726 [Suillus bovinus]KAG2148669.1 hypothetical protein EDB93DRAFT_1103726 [Suillus bovinus]